MGRIYTVEDWYSDHVPGQSRTYAATLLAQEQYSAALGARARAVSVNRSRRMRGLALVPVPERPADILIPRAYTRDGEYLGCLYADAPPALPEVPADAVIRMEAR